MDGGNIAEAAPADKPKKAPVRRAELSETRFAYEFYDYWTHRGFGPFNWRCETSDWRTGRFWFDLQGPGHGVGWVDGDEAIAHMRAHMVALIESLCAEEPGEEIRKRSCAKWCAANRVSGALTIANSLPGIITRPDRWDANPDTLGAPDLGTARLRLGDVTTQNRDELISKCLAVRPDPDCPTPALDCVLDHMSGGNRALRDFYQLALGMSLYGHNAEERAFFWHGEGASGKSTLLSAVLAALGGYGARLNRETLEGERSQHLTFLASLIGARIAVVAELEGEDLKTGRFKALVGGDEMMVNRMRRDPVTFRCVATIHAMANPDCLPQLRVVDESIRRRIVVIPAGASVPAAERDPDIKRRMMGEELPGIMQWLIDGAKRYAVNGFAMPEAVTDATSRFFAEASPIGRWIGERCETGPHRTPATDLYLDFNAWYREMGFRRTRPSMTAWGRTLTGLGYDKVKSHGAIMRDGLRLRYQPEPGYNG